MELLLNLAWAFVAISTLALWLHSAPRTGRRMQFVALAMLLLILFPVISVTDDLQLPQNPAEADCCVRRDHVVPNPHSILPAVADLHQPGIDDLLPGLSQRAAIELPVLPALEDPGRGAISIRPPPGA